MLKVIQRVYPVVEKVFPSLAHRFFITVFFTPINYGVPEKEKPVENDAEKFTIVVNGKKIQCYAWGSGPVVLLVHGWAGRATQFRKFIPALVAAGFGVVGFDGPAHGKSEGRSTNIPEFEKALAALYDRTGTPVGIVAHSFGGGAVLSAAANGLPVPKLVSIASPTIGDEIIATYLKTINASPDTARFFKDYVLRTTGKPFDEYTSLHFVTRIRPDMPILLVYDEDDEQVPPKHGQVLKERYPGAQLLTTRGLGHTRILRDEEVIKRSISFLKS